MDNTMNMNLVFNLDDIEELVQLTEALTDLKTLKARAKLEQDIKELSKKRAELRKEVNELEPTKEESPNRARGFGLSINPNWYRSYIDSLSTSEDEVEEEITNIAGSNDE